MARGVISRLCSMICAVAISLPQDFMVYAATAATPSDSPSNSSSALAQSDSFKLIGTDVHKLPGGLEFKIALARADDNATSDVTVGCFNKKQDFVAQVRNVTSYCNSLVINTQLPLEITVPYDANAVPIGNSENDIRLFRLEPVAFNGPMSPLASFIDTKNKATVSTITEKTGVYINGILRPGERPDQAPVLFSQPMLQSAGTVEIKKGKPYIPAPVANTDGDLRLSYPIEFPGAREDFTPQVAIGYSAQSVSGNIARGWNLSVPSISVETRWGVPEYDSKYETETYLFNGEQLVPEAGGYFVDPQIGSQAAKPNLHPSADDEKLATLKLVPMPYRTSKLRPRKSGQAHFVLRRDDGLWRFARYGDDPASYWWEAVQESPAGEKLKTLDFGRHPGRIEDDLGAPIATEFNSGTVKPVSFLTIGPMTGNSNPNSISRWALAREVDSNKNIIDYDWVSSCQLDNDQVCSANESGLAADRDLYLKRVIYTGHADIEESVLRCREDPSLEGCKRKEAQFEALFTWSNSSQLKSNLRRTDARSGGLIVSRRLLTQIDFRLRRRSLVETAGSSGSLNFVSYLGISSWECSNSYRRYKFETIPDPMFANATASPGLDSGAAPAWLDKVKMLVGRNDLGTDELEIKDGNIFPNGLENGSAKCGKAPNFVVAEASTHEEVTRFSYHAPKNNEFYPFSAEAKRIDSHSVASLSKIDTGDRIKALRTLVAGLGNDKGPYTPSMLGSSLTEDTEGGFYFGVGLYVPQKALSAGPKWTFSQRTKQKDLSMLLDVTGDGLPDLLVNEGGSWSAYPSEITAKGEVKFGSSFRLPLPSGFRFQHEPVLDVRNHGFEGHLFVVGTGSTSGSTTTVQTTYLADMDGDGRADVVTPNGVFYNSSASGISQAEGIQINTPYVRPPNGQPGIAQPKILATASNLQSQYPKSNENPRYDAVRIWRAPFDGVIRVTGDAMAVARDDIPEIVWSEDPILQSQMPAAHRDGVIVSVERSRGNNVDQCAVSTLSPAVLDRLETSGPFGSGTWQIFGSRVAQHGPSDIELAYYRVTLVGPRTSSKDSETPWVSRIRLKIDGSNAVFADAFSGAMQQAVDQWNTANAVTGKLAFNKVDKVLSFTAQVAGPQIPPLTVAVSLSEPANHVVSLERQDESGGPGNLANRVETRVVPRLFSPGDPSTACSPAAAATVEQLKNILVNASLPLGMLLEVSKDDFIYFRTHSIDNASDDAISWSPFIQYLEAVERRLPGPNNPDEIPSEFFGPNVTTQADIVEMARTTSTLCRSNELPRFCDLFGRNVLRFRPSATSSGGSTNPGDIPLLAQLGSGLLAPSTGVLRIQGGIQKPKTLNKAQLELVILPHDIMDGRIKKIDGDEAPPDKDHPLSSRLKSCDPKVARPQREIVVEDRDKNMVTVSTRGWLLKLKADGSTDPTPLVSMGSESGTYSIFDSAGDVSKKPECATRKMRRENPAACGADLNELNIVQGDKVCLIVRDGENTSSTSDFSPVDAAAYALVETNPLTSTYTAFLDVKADGTLKNADGSLVPAYDPDECFSDSNGQIKDLQDYVCIKGRDAYYTTPIIENGKVGVVTISGTEKIDPATLVASRAYYRSEGPLRSVFKSQIPVADGAEAPSLTCDWGDAGDKQTKLQERRFVLDLGSFRPQEQYLDNSRDRTAYGDVQAVMQSRVVAYSNGRPQPLKLRRFAVFERIGIDQSDGSTILQRVARKLQPGDLAGDPNGNGVSKPDLVFDSGQPFDVVQQELRFMRGSTGTVAVSELAEAEHWDPDGEKISRDSHRLASNYIGYSVCAPPNQDVVLESVLNEPDPHGPTQAIDRLLGQAECSDISPPTDEIENNPEDLSSNLPLPRTRSNICPLSRASIKLAEVTGKQTYGTMSLPLSVAFQAKTLEESVANGDDPYTLGVTHRRFDIEAIGPRQAALAFIGHLPDQSATEAGDIKDPITRPQGDFPVDDAALLNVLPSFEVLNKELINLAKKAKDWAGPLTDALESNQDTSCPANPQTPAQKAACNMSATRIPAFGINTSYRTAENPGAAISVSIDEPSAPVPVDQATLCSWMGRATFRRMDEAQLLDKKIVAGEQQAIIARANWNLSETKQSAAANAGGYTPNLCGIGPDQSLWVSGAVLSPSRLGMKDLHYGIEAATYVDPNAPASQSLTEPGRGVGITPPPRVSSGGDSGGFKVVAFSGNSHSTNDITSSTDVFDVNGDGFPDIIGSGGVILTDPFGVARCNETSPWNVTEACSRSSPPQFTAPVRKSHSLVGSKSLDISTNQMTTLIEVANAAGAMGQSASAKNNPQTGKTTQATYGFLGFSKNSGESVETRTRDLIDLNGDGLPDEYTDGSNITINRGSDFTAVNNSAVSGVIGGRSRSSGIGINAGISSAYNDNSFEAGLAASVSAGDLAKTIADINADGLPDMLEVSDHGVLSARLNKGVSFSAPIDFGTLSNGINNFGRTESDRANAGGAYTYSYCICLPFVQIYLHFNPNASIGGVLTRQTTLFKDIDGDGLPDVVFGESLLDTIKHGNLGISDNSASFISNGLAQYGLLESVMQAGNQSSLPNLEFIYSKSQRTANDPNPRWVLAQSIVRDGVTADDGPDVKDNSRKTCFSYSGGFFDRFERRFLGYERVDEVQGCKETAAPIVMVNDQGPNRSKGIRLIERHYANRTLYEAGLMLSESVFDISSSPDLGSTAPEEVAKVRQAQKRRELDQSYVLVDTALSSHERIICHNLRTPTTERSDLLLLASGFVRNVSSNVKPDGCRETFTAGEGSNEPTFDTASRRLTPFMVQAVRRTWEDGSDRFLLTAMQADFDQFARVTRNCDLGEIDPTSPTHTRGATCSNISYADYVTPSFAHGATGGGRIIISQRNLASRVEVVDYSKAANPDLTAAYDQQSDKLVSLAPVVRLRAASYDPESGQMVRSCQFVNPQDPASNPCEGFHHFVRDGDALKQSATANVAMRSFQYDAFGNLIRYVGPMGSGESFVSKSYKYDPYLSLVAVSERTDYCNTIGLADGPKAKSIECLNSHVAALGNLESVATLIDYRHVIPTLVRDINGNATFTPFDGLGRPLSMFVDWKGVVGPPCSESPICQLASRQQLINTSATQIASYTYSDLASISGTLSGTVIKYSDEILYPHADTGTPYVSLRTKTLFDNLGNRIQTLSPAELCAFSKPDDMSPECLTQDQFAVSPLEITDALGRAISEGYQATFHVADLTQYSDALDLSKFHSEIAYDGLDRPLMVNLPDGPSSQLGARSGNAYDFYYSVEPSNSPGIPARHRTYARDAACVPTAIDRDVRGLIRAVTESSNSTSVEGVRSAALSSTGSIDGSTTNEEQKAIYDGGLIENLQPDIATHQQIVRCKQPRGSKFQLASYRSEATYNYDALGQLVAVNLPLRQNNPKLQRTSILTAYDGLGRRVVIDDPDRGFEKTSLDVLGNAACRYSGKRHGMIMPSDLFADQSAILSSQCPDPTAPAAQDHRIERLVQSTYLGGLPLEVSYKLFGPMSSGQTKAASRTVRYRYGQADDASRAANRVGRPYETDDAAGPITQNFDELGRPVETLRTYNKLALFGPNVDRPTVHTTQTFDVWGLPKDKRILADIAGKPVKGKPAPKNSFDESISYQYTIGGQLLSEQSWSGPQRPQNPIKVISDMSYDQRGNLIGVGYATGVKTRQDFAENSNRLTLARARLAGDMTTATRAILFQDLHYAYDASGNVIAYENTPSLENPCDPPAEPGNCVTHPSLAVELANSRGLLIRSSSNRFAYDQLNRIRSSSKTLISAFSPSQWDYEGEPQVLTDPEIARTKNMQLAFNETFAFEATHELSLLKQVQALTDLKKGKTVTQTEISRYVPDAIPLHAPSSIETKLVEQKRTRTTGFGYDAFGRMQADLCKHDKEPKACWPDQYFTWNADDSLAGQVAQIADARLPETKKKLLKYVYYNNIQSEFGSDGERIYKLLSEETWQPGKNNPVASHFVSDTLYVDPNLTIIRRPGEAPQAIVNYFVGDQRLASRWSGDGRLFTYHAQLQTQNVSDIVVGLPAQPASARIHGQQEYAAFGEVVHEQETMLVGNVDGQPSRNKPGLPQYRYNAKELDESGLQNFGVRFYSDRLAFWLRPDPVLHDYLGGQTNVGVLNSRNLAAYTFAWGNPIYYRDSDGNAPNAAQTGTLGEVIADINKMTLRMSDGRLVANVGTLRGKEAYEALMRMGDFKFSPRNPEGKLRIFPIAPVQQLYGPDKKRYINTKEGPIDMEHFLSNAGRGSKAKMNALDQVGQIFTTKLEGFAFEFAQLVSHRQRASAFSPEDMPSNERGQDFGTFEFDPKSTDTLSNQINLYFLKNLVPE